MTIDADLKELVRFYAEYHEDTQSYSGALDNSTLLRLDNDFAKLINKILLEDGIEKDKIAKNYKKLTLYFHPDKQVTFTPEVRWLEECLSEGKNDGICFKTLSFCYEKLNEPQKFKETNVDDIKSKDQLRKWLEKNRDQAPTYTTRSLYVRLISLMDQVANYYDDVGKINSKGIRFIVGSLPLLFMIYGAVILADELFAIYALYLLVYKGGQKLEAKDSDEMRLLGKTLQEASVITATVTSTLIVSIFELTFWLSRHGYNKSLQIGSALLKPMLTNGRNNKKPAEENQYPCTEQLSKEIVLASTNMSEGKQFNSQALKLIAAPMESYLGLNKQQFFVSWRPGLQKRDMVEAFLMNLVSFDMMDWTLETKIEKAEEELLKIKNEPSVYFDGSNTAKAVDRAEQVLNLLKESSNDLQMISSEQPRF